MRKVRSVLALTLWMTGVVAVFADLPGMADARLGLLVAFLAFATLIASRLTLTVAAVAAMAGAVWLVHSFADFGPIVSGLRFALVFTIFLPAIVLIRETLEVSPEINTARAAFQELPAPERTTGVMIGSQLLGVVLTLGVMAMTAPLVERDSPEPQRRETILSVLRGLMLGGLWTPFSVGVIYITGFRPSLDLIELVLPGFVVASVGTIIAVIVGAGVNGLSQIPRALRIFSPLMPMIGASIVAVMLVASFTPFSSIQAVSLVMPLLCALKLASVGAYTARNVVARHFQRLGETGNELLLFAAAVVLGALVRDSGAADALVSFLSLDRIPVELAIVVLMLLGPLFSLAGMHSILIGTLLFALLGPLDERIPDIIEGQIVIFGWMCGAILSVGSLSITLGTGLFRVSVGRIVLSRNMVFVAVFTAVTTVLFLVWLELAARGGATA